MIFLYHLYIMIAASLGLCLAMLLTRKFKVKTHIMLFILFIGIGLFIHFMVDSITSSKEDFIRYYINLEPHEHLTLDFLLTKLVQTSQYPFISD